jgi:DNA-binding HxlR family transcriptional regulator
MRLEDCPVRAALDVIGGKWKPVILYHLLTGPKRHGELRRLLADATQKMLTQQLRELERDGIIARKVYPELPPRVEYGFTPHGRTLRPVIRELCKWGEAFPAKSRGLFRSAA